MKNSLSFILLFVVSASIAQQKNKITPIAKDIYVHTSFNEYKGQSFPANGLIVVTPNSILLVDTAWGEEQTKELIDWIKKELKKPVSHLIVTHSHEDRTSGIPVLKKEFINIKVLSTDLTAQKIKELNLPSSDLLLPMDTTLNINGIRIQTYYPGAGHTSDNIVVYVPESHVLFGGCFIKSTEATGLGNVADANLKEWPQSLNRLKQKFPSPKIIVPGHQGWTHLNAIEYTLQLLKENESKGN